MTTTPMRYGNRRAPRPRADKILIHIKRAGRIKATVRSPQKLRVKGPFRDFAAAMRRI